MRGRPSERRLSIAALGMAALLASNLAAGASASRWKPRDGSTSNTAPVISGTPSTTVQVATSYLFTPRATDAENNRLAFSISNKPKWASFSSSTGRLSGTPAAANAGEYRNIVISVSDGALRASLPPFTLTVTAAPISAPAVTVNAPPQISGSPATVVEAGTAYSFVPTASDPEGRMLGFSIANKPAWAIFSTASGALTGTPSASQTGAYGGVVISVSDGVSSASLPAFAITVQAAASSPPPSGSTVTPPGAATLSWTSPTLNVDGSTLTNLAGYRVYHGLGPTALNETIQVAGAGTTTYTFQQLASGTHYFAVSAYNGAGEESALSAIGSKTIP